MRTLIILVTLFAASTVNSAGSNKSISHIIEVCNMTGIAAEVILEARQEGETISSMASNIAESDSDEAVKEFYMFLIKKAFEINIKTSPEVFRDAVFTDCYDARTAD